ncbi:pectinesterase inhibitor 7-like [Argentina anserina]|uniref:pectinesterase inhibitor 7-like n=1 Tax=Argentina anserina TaxID=57926 RepID=UPI0021765BAB|nr:pectinesterase inhibitor 7-like [Potentilla anserina]
MEGYRVYVFVLSLAVFLLFDQLRPCTAARSVPSQANTDYIKSSCKASRYPDLCYNSLQMYATEIKTSPKTLALTALNVTLELTKQSQTGVNRLAETRGLSSVENKAMGDCVKQLKATEKELQSSKSELALIVVPANSRLQISNVQTWVSAALTDASTCTDDFADRKLNGQVEIDTANYVKKVESMISIALTFINSYATSS